MAYEILASSGYPTLEVMVTLDSGAIGRASVPYGASAGSHEATVLIDGDKSRYLGKGSSRAIENALKLAHKLEGFEFENPRQLDEKLIALDGTQRKEKFGGNTVLAISLATARALANQRQLPLYKYLIEAYSLTPDFSQLPQPMLVSIEGGKHANNSTDLQEFCLSTIRPEFTPTENIRVALESYHHLNKILQEKDLSTNVGNEGAFAPSGLESNRAPLELLVQAIETAGYEPGKDISISIDAAASEFFQNGQYFLKLENRTMTSTELIDYFSSWLKEYPIMSFEDMLHEDDWQAWPQLKKVCDQHQTLLIGDDLTVTNKDRLQKAIDTDSISSILIKLNQSGTLTETVDVCQLAKQNNLTTVPSHRGGGETNDTFMVDLAVAVGASHIKVGPTRGERVAKYNRLMKIEAELQLGK